MLPMQKPKNTFAGVVRDGLNTSITEKERRVEEIIRDRGFIDFLKYSNLRNQLRHHWTRCWWRSCEVDESFTSGRERIPEDAL